MFAEFDHAANAREVDLELAPTTVLVFGDAAVGTYLMQDDPACALHLPLKLTLLEKDDGTEVRYEPPESWGENYDLSEKSQGIIEKMTGLLKVLAETVL